MMKKYLLPVCLLSLFANSCDVLHEKEMIEKRKAATLSAQNTPTKVPAMPAEKATLFTKTYQFKTGQSYIRNVESNYFGPQAALLSEMSKHNVKRGFNIEDYIKYSKASFFQTDVYEIPADMKGKATEQFRPLIDSIFLQAGNYPSFHAEILVMGYTDESPIPFNSTVYNQLLSMTKQQYFNYNDYYNALSFFRAKQVSDLISGLIADKKSGFSQFEKFTFDIITEGRGIEFPDAKRNYNLQDDKRKITKVYWKVVKS
jgi:hypothetical protein